MRREERDNTPALVIGRSALASIAFTAALRASGSLWLPSVLRATSARRRCYANGRATRTKKHKAS